jgi:maleylpyruvate isomerase
MEGGEVMRLTQSLAIIEYLDDAFPHPRLLPEDPIRPARVRQLAEIVNAGIQPLQNLEVSATCARSSRATRRPGRGTSSAAACARWRPRRCTRRAPTSSATQVTLADCCLVPQLYACRRFGVDVSACPTLLRVEASAPGARRLQASHPDAQPDAQP